MLDHTKRTKRTSQVVAVVLFFLVVMPSAVLAETGSASWYSTEACKFNPAKHCPTAGGQSLYALEKEKKDFCASWVYPLGSILEVTNRANGRSVIVTVLDRGPARRLNRVIDLSKSAFEKIGELKKGIITVDVKKVNYATH